MKFREEYAFLSNMFIAPFTISTRGGKSLKFKSVENAFQYFKCTDPIIAKQIADASPKEAKRLGRKCPMRSNWNELKVAVMTSLVKAKFSCNPDLYKKLKTITGPIVEENTWKDTFWGVCNGKGLNMLGKILMQVRDDT